jgi:hypothetical protein
VARSLGELTDDDFNRSMQRYAELAAKHSTPYLLVDVRPVWSREGMLARD